MHRVGQHRRRQSMTADVEHIDREMIVIEREHVEGVTGQLGARLHRPREPHALGQR